jgi:transcriptional antiterminator RfaH
VYHGRKITTRPLLFYPYVFVLVTEYWPAARRAPGVQNLIMDGTGPCTVSEAVIMELRSRENGDGVIVLSNAPRFRPGDMVKVMAGPFDGLTGLVDGLPGTV